MGLTQDVWDAERRVRLGAVVWTFAIQFFVAQVVVQCAWTTPFRLTQNFISDLGNTACAAYPPGSATWVCSPRHGLMNASFIALGATILLGAALVRRGFPAGRTAAAGLALLALAGAGLILVGWFPENESLAIHKTGAALQFVSGNAGMCVLGIALARARAQPVLAAGSLAAGALGLLATLLFVSDVYLGLGVGGMERLAVYPLPLWLIAIGVSFFVR